MHSVTPKATLKQNLKLAGGTGMYCSQITKITFTCQTGVLLVCITKWHFSLLRGCKQ